MLVVAKYAAETSVPAERSRAEIERTLVRYGADQFIYGWRDDKAVIQFRMFHRQVKFVMPIPDVAQFRLTPTRRLRTPTAMKEAHDQAIRQRWRALLMIVKAKLEAVEDGITSFEQEFLAHVLLPNGETVGEWIQPQVELAYETGAMPAMLLQLESGELLLATAARIEQT